MGLDEIIKGRYSVRNYSDKPVEKETFDRIIEAWTENWENPSRFDA